MPLDLDAILGRVRKTRTLDLDNVIARVRSQARTAASAPRPQRRATPGPQRRAAGASFVRLEHTVGHNKFWEARVRPIRGGVVLAARWGRIGSSGQSAEWTFDDAEAAQRELTRKVRSKLAKGYVQVEGPSLSTAATRDLPTPPPVALAKVWDWNSDPTGWHASEKLDGVRAWWLGTGMLSRQGNPIRLSPLWAGLLPPTVLDGELWLGRGRFHEVLSVSRKPDDPRWAQMRYKVFDAPEIPGGCEERYARLRKIVDRACSKWRGPGPCPLVFVEQTVCRSKAELQRMHAKIAAVGGQGMMIRAPRSTYRAGRTSELLKVLQFISGEARIIGYKRSSKGRGRLGSYEAVLLENGIPFYVGTGIPEAERYDPLPIGTIITVRYKNLSRRGHPTQPVYVGPRA